MKLFLDTSVLMGASSANHPQHTAALGAMESLRDGHNQAWISQHTLAETYAILTSAPLTPPAIGRLAQRKLRAGPGQSVHAPSHKHAKYKRDNDDSAMPNQQVNSVLAIARDLKHERP